VWQIFQTNIAEQQLALFTIRWNKSTHCSVQLHCSVLILEW